MKSLTPFANDTESQNVGGLTLENGSDRIVISGDLEITKDKLGLRRAQDLKAVIDKIVKSLKAEPELPDELKVEIEKPKTVDNPFES